MPRTYIIPNEGKQLFVMGNLGKGQFGCAKTVKTEKGELFCLKEVNMRGKGETARQDAQKEVEIIKKCNHPNIVKYYHLWFDRFGMFMVMELASNGSLHTIIQRHKKEGKFFTSLQVQHYLQQLASALAYIHVDLRIIHRDIKPENVLVGDLGELKLADFGLSKLLAPGSDLCATFLGSPLYMSPELCSGAEYSVAADIWATGCLLYEVMTLQSPWEAVIEESGISGIPALLKKIRESSPSYDVLISRYPPKIVRTVRWMLCKTVEKRATAEQLVDLLEIRDPPMKNLRDTIDARRSISPTYVQDELEPVTHSEEPVIQSAALKRQATLLEEAMNLVKAANVIQRSFRLSKQMQDQRFEIADKMVPATAKALRLMDRRPSQPVKRTTDPRLPPLTAHNDASVVIQRAARLSLNRRRREVVGATPQTAPKASNIHIKRTPLSRPNIPPPCSARTAQLATPRPRVAQPPVSHRGIPQHPPSLPVLHRRVPTTRMNPTGTPRPAWM